MKQQTNKIYATASDLIMSVSTSSLASSIPATTTTTTISSFSSSSNQTEYK